jgi:hypothetical protein
MASVYLHTLRLGYLHNFHLFCDSVAYGNYLEVGK